MISVRFFPNARIHRYPATLEFAVIVVAHADQQMTFSILHLHEILIFYIDFWKIFDGRRRDNPFFSPVDFAPHQRVFSAILPEHSGNSRPAIVGIGDGRKQHASEGQCD